MLTLTFQILSLHVFISWLNLDIGFDICFKDESELLVDQLYKGLLQLAFPVFVIVLVIIVIVASQCSSKFAKIIGKGNPAAVLAIPSSCFLIQNF